MNWYIDPVPIPGNTDSVMAATNKTILPFSISTRKDSPFYYVRFKNEETGKYLSWLSTGETDRKKAVSRAFDWYRNGIPQKGNSISVESTALKQLIHKKLHELSDHDKEYILSELVKEGFIKSYIRTGSTQDIRAVDFMLNFWNYDSSPYVAEKLRKEKGITKRYCITQGQYINKYWKPFLTDKLLGEVSKQDLKQFMLFLDQSELSNSSKLHIMTTGLKVLRWAFANEYIDRDITAGLEAYSGKSKTREILTPEMVQALFAIEWTDPRAKLANMVSMCTGLRAGEIQALKMKDLGKDCLYINHNWNPVDGLKAPKNGETRTVYLPFPQIIEKLKELGESNPYNQGMEGFIFWAMVPYCPMDNKIFLRGLRESLTKIGVSDSEAQKYTFHSWRHFFTSYMNDKVNQKVLQKQTGHKTLTMLEHYASHEIQGDIDRLEQAQREVFGEYLSGSTELTFDQNLIGRNIWGEYRK